MSPPWELLIFSCHISLCQCLFSYLVALVWPRVGRGSWVWSCCSCALLVQMLNTPCSQMRQETLSLADLRIVLLGSLKGDHILCHLFGFEIPFLEEFGIIFSKFDSEDPWRGSCNVPSKSILLPWICISILGWSLENSIYISWDNFH